MPDHDSTERPGTQNKNPVGDSSVSRPSPSSAENVVRLLLVDDQPRNLEVLETILQSPDYQLVRASSGDEALLALMKDDFAALVLDIQMPGMSGIELARIVKQRKRNQHIPILFLTAHYLDDTDILEGYGVGAVDYLTKPINPQILRSKVGVYVELLRTTRALSRANTALENEIRQRRDAEEALRQANDVLEERVQQRTAELSRSEEQFRRAIEEAPIPVIMHAEDGQVLQVSKTWITLTGYALEDLPTFDAWLTRAYGFGANEVRSAVRSLFERDAGVVEAEFEILTRAGDKRVWAFSASSPGVLHDGRRFVVCTALDITDRKKAEIALRESEAFSRSILEGSTDCIKVLDHEGRLISMNGPGIRLMEIDDFQSVARTRWLDFWKDEHLAAAANALAVALAGGIGRFQGICLTTTGNAKWWDVAVSRIPSAEGQTPQLVCISRDITETKKAELALHEAKEAAEAASKAKDNFMASLSHELRTPLNPALLLASDRERDTKLPAELRHDFASIRKDIELEARLIDDLLDLTRISHGKVRLEPRPVDLHSLLRASWERLASEAREKDLQIIFDLAPATPWVQADPIRLQQVFWNVMRNAVRYTPTRGWIRVHTEPGPDDAWRVDIADNGAGIESHQLEGIFQAFSQGENGTRFGGIGLGLAISRQLLELQGGHICARSNGRGCGAVFSIDLPSTQPAAETTEAGSLSPATERSDTTQRILLVEDHTQTRTTLARLLTQRGHEVATAENIEEALVCAQTFAFDLVLSDLGLPDGSGHELFAELRQLRPGCRGIALSGYGMEGDVRRSLEAGFNAHLTKPVNIQALEAVLKQSADGGAPASP